MNAQDGLPLGYPKEGALVLCTTPALTICQAPGCTAGVSVITCHAIHVTEAEEHHLHLLCHQLCDRHAEQNKRALRGRYTVRASAVVWL
jgi:hypothetical protein